MHRPAKRPRSRPATAAGPLRPASPRAVHDRGGDEAPASETTTPKPVARPKPKQRKVLQLDRLPAAGQYLLGILFAAAATATAIAIEEGLLTGLLAIGAVAALLCRRYHDDYVPDCTRSIGFRRVRGNKMTWFERVRSSIVFAPLMALMALGLIVFIREFWDRSPTLVALVTTTLAAVIAVAGLRHHAANHINTVVGGPAKPSNEADRQATDHVPDRVPDRTPNRVPNYVPPLPPVDAPPKLLSPAAASTKPFPLRVVDLDRLPIASSESRTAVGREQARGHRVRTLYAKTTVMLAVATVLLSCLHSNRGQFMQAIGTVHGMLWIAYFALRNHPFVAAASAATGALRRFANSSVRPDYPQHKHNYRPLGPRFWPAHGLAWSITACWSAATIHSSSEPQPWLSCLLLLLPIVTVAALFVQRRRLEREQPVFEPFNLLGLRVFGTPYLDKFGVIVSGWNRIGNWLQLDGPDTIGSKARDWLNVLLGRTEDSVVEDEQELHEEFERFNMSRDSSLRCRDNSMQCNDATWQQALDRLLEMADVVVMDLSGLTAEDRGCAYEITRLFEVMPLAKVMFLIDDDTDRTTLDAVFQIARDARTEASCNRDLRGELEIYRAVPLPEGDGVQAPPFGRAVIESLRDRATMLRPARHQARQPRWTATGWSRPMELLAYAGVLTTIVAIVVQIAS